MSDSDGATKAAQRPLFDIRESAPQADAVEAKKTVTVNVRATTYKRRPPTRRPKEPETIEERLRRGRQARDKAIASVASHVDEDWLTFMLAIAERLAKSRQTFASFDLTDEYDRDQSPTKPPPPHDNRAVGHVMQTAKARGWIEPTDQFVPTPVKEHHAAPKRVWRSLLFEGRLTK